MKEDPTMKWLITKIQSYIRQGDREMAQKFINTYRPLIKYYDEEKAMEALKPQIKQRKRKKEAKKTYKTKMIIDKEN